MDKLLLTPTEAAAALGIGRTKLYELLRSGRLGSIHIGTSRRIPTQVVQSFVSDLSRSRQPGIPSGAPDN